MSGKFCCKETACKASGYLKVSEKEKKIGRKERLSSLNSYRCEQGSLRDGYDGKSGAGGGGGNVELGSNPDPSVSYSLFSVSMSSYHTLQTLNW